MEAEAPKCLEDGCEDDATHYPVLTFKAPIGPATATFQMHEVTVCEAHTLQIKLSQLMPPETWEEMMGAFDQRGQTRPSYKDTGLVWKPLDG